MAKNRTVIWPYLLLGVALLGALGFGWYQTRQKNQLALESENKYMAAFHKLKWTSENIEERTTRLLATSDPSLQESLLADLRVFSAQAVEHMSVLPLMTMNTPRITNFLNSMRERADEYHDKVNRGTALTDEDWRILVELRHQAAYFDSELSNLLGLVGSNMISWRDTVRVTGRAQTGDAETPIIRSVMQVDAALAAPLGEQGAPAPGQTPLHQPKVDLGPRVTPAEAIAATKRFLDTPLKGEPTLTGQSDPDAAVTEASLYFIAAEKSSGTPLNFGVSMHGGHIIYMLDGRAVTNKSWDSDRLERRSREILHRLGYPDVRLTSAIENDGTFVMDFAPVQGEVAIHTEMIRLSLAMDDGEFVGFDARNYWVNRQSRKLDPPALSELQARLRLAPRLKVESGKGLAVVADRMGLEHLVWQYTAAMDDQRFIIFVDANSGAEVNLLRVQGDPAPPLQAG